MNFKWVTDLNRKAKSVRLVEGNIRANIWELVLATNFSDRTQKHKSKEKKIDKLDSIKIQNFCSLKDIL